MTDDFAQKYGRWAVIAGASEGVGASLADQLAERGLDLVLIARNEKPSWTRSRPECASATASRYVRWCRT